MTKATAAFVTMRCVSVSGVSPSWRPHPCICSTAAAPPMLTVAVTAP